MLSTHNWPRKRHFGTLSKLFRQVLDCHVLVAETDLDGEKCGLIYVDREYFGHVEKRLELLLRDLPARKTA